MQKLIFILVIGAECAYTSITFSNGLAFRIIIDPGWPGSFDETNKVLAFALKTACERLNPNSHSDFHFYSSVSITFLLFPTK